MTETKPLKMSCTDSRCEEDLHCFRPKRGMAPTERGRCRDCGADLVDWETVHERDINQVTQLFAELPKELIRHHYWHMAIPQDIREKAERYRREVVANRVVKAIGSRLSAPSGEIYHDGTQTPMEDSPGAQIYYLGMHATATCCRKCMEYWHGIPREEALTDEQLSYFVALVWLYVCQRLGWKDSVQLLAP